MAKDYYNAIADFDKIKKEIQDLEYEQKKNDRRYVEIENMLQAGDNVSSSFRPITFSGIVYVSHLNVMY